MIDCRFSFDVRELLGAADRAEQKILMGAGGYCRKVARNSIKPASGKESSQSEQPPKGHRETNETYRNSIYFAYDKGAHEVVIGGELLSKRGQGVPEKIEYGGDEDVVTYDPVTKKQVRRRASYQPRPAMRLAFQKTVEEALPRFIANSVTK